MSVTITIGNNDVYCREHRIEDRYREECLCTDLANGDMPNPECPYCKGSGEIEFLRRPYELNIADGNFHTLWSALGLELNEEHIGCVDGRRILAALEFGSELAERAGSETRGKQGAVWIDCGIRPEQAARYFEMLRLIADEAARREEPVVWC